MYCIARYFSKITSESLFFPAEFHSPTQLCRSSPTCTGSNVFPFFWLFTVIRQERKIVSHASLLVEVGQEVFSWVRYVPWFQIRGNSSFRAARGVEQDSSSYFCVLVVTRVPQGAWKSINAYIVMRGLFCVFFCIFCILGLLPQEHRIIQKLTF